MFFAFLCRTRIRHRFCIDLGMGFTIGRREKRTKEEKKDQKDGPFFFLSLNQISTKTHYSNTKKTRERSTTTATPFTENAQKDFRRADIFFFSSCMRYLVAERRERRERFKNGFLGKKDGRGTSTSSTRPCKRGRR